MDSSSSGGTMFKIAAYNTDPNAICGACALAIILSTVTAALINTPSSLYLAGIYSNRSRSSARVSVSTWLIKVSATQSFSSVFISARSGPYKALICPMRMEYSADISGTSDIYNSNSNSSPAGSPVPTEDCCVAASS